MKDTRTLITPTMAAEWLTRNKKTNRPLRERVETYARDVATDNVRFCLDPIAFDAEGNLINGQHRLWAIVKAGKPAKFFVVFGAPADTEFDTGAMRTTRDALIMQGIVPRTISRGEVTIAKNYIRLATWKMPSNAEIAALISTDGDFIEKAYRISGSNGQITKKAGVQIALYSALKAGVSEQELIRFIRIVNTLRYDDIRDTAAIVLYKWLAEEFHRYAHGQAAISMTCKQTETALSDFLARKPRVQKYKNPRHIYLVKEVNNGSDKHSKR